MKRVPSVAAGLALALAACTGGGNPQITPRPTGPEIPRGGTLVAGLYGAVPTELDPQKDYNFSVWELWRCCLGRTLLSYNGKPADEGGSVPRPDLAREMPIQSDDGRTWTFHLKPGIHYAPPMADTTVESSDFVRALDRMASTGVNPVHAYTYDFYYSVIEGFDAYRSGRADTISGLETPDPLTLVVRLTHPEGDLPFLFALPATAPIPPSPADPSAPSGVATGHDEDYGRFLVSSGPYMIEGSPDLDPSLPADEQDPVSGYDPFVPRGHPPDFAGTHGGEVMLVRDPSWDPSTDPLRAAYPDRIRLFLAKVPGRDQRSPAIFRAIRDGRMDLIFDADPLPTELSTYDGDASLKPYVFSLEENAVWFLTMNLALPPFDDMHARRAVAATLDRDAIARISGTGYAPGPAVPATHLAPDAVEGGLLSAYGAASQGGGGADLATAHAEMARSDYDRDGDGVCDAQDCRDVELLAANYGRGGAGFPSERISKIVDVIVRDLAPLGIEIHVRRISDGFASSDEVRAMATDPEQHVPLTVNDWQADFPGGSAFFPYWFDGRRIGEQDTYAVSLLGASPDQLAAWGYDSKSVPNVDVRIDRCLASVGQVQVECWAELDQYLSDEVVPWVPLLFTQASRVTSTRIASFSWDQFVGMPALDRIALKPEGSS